MTIYGIKGRPRSGKTALGAKMLTQHWRYGYCPVSNVEVDFYANPDNLDVESTWPKSIPLSIRDINKALDENISLNELYQAELICMYISELMQYVFSRKSSSNTNALIAYMLSQVGKQNVTFIHDEQLSHTIDVIVRELTEYEISSYKWKFTGEYNGKIYNNCLKGFYYTMEDKSEPGQNPYEFFWPIEKAINTLDSYESNTPYRSEVLQLKITQPSGHDINKNNLSTKTPSKMVF